MFFLHGTKTFCTQPVYAKPRWLWKRMLIQEDSGGSLASILILLVYIYIYISNGPPQNFMQQISPTPKLIETFAWLSLKASNLRLSLRCSNAVLHTLKIWSNALRQLEGREANGNKRKLTKQAKRYVECWRHIFGVKFFVDVEYLSIFLFLRVKTNVRTPELLHTFLLSCFEDKLLTALCPMR